MTNNMRELSISVILPIYIAESSISLIQQLDDAISSVMEQEYPGEMEILLIDNGPIPVTNLIDKGSLSIPRELRIIRTPRSNGLVHALNVGLREAKHDWIARIDADDTWSPGKIGTQTARIFSDPDLTIIGTGMTRRFVDCRPPDEHIRPDGWDNLIHFYENIGCPFPHGSILARLSIYRLLGGYSHHPTVAYCEDYALWGNWLRFFKPGMIEASLYNYTVSDSQVSTVHHQQQLAASVQVKEAFRTLNLSGRLPILLGQLSSNLGISLVQAGVLCYRLWHFRPCYVSLPKIVSEDLSSILVDRTIRELSNDQGERFLLTINDLLHDYMLDKKRIQLTEDTITLSIF